MTKAELIAAVAEEAGIKKSLAEKTLDAFIDTIAKAMKKRREGCVDWVGTFQCSREKQERGETPRQEKRSTSPRVACPGSNRGIN